VRALVIAASGQVGAALSASLAARGHAVVGTHHRVAAPGTRPLDLTDPAAVAALMAEVEPDWVFCPAGLTHVDYCEDHPDEAWRINCDGPAAAARLAGQRGAAFVYYSTDYVFDGRGGPYCEEDPPNPLSVYGQSKLAGERAVLAAAPRALVIRTAVVYGPEPQGKNTVYQLLRRLRAGQCVPVPADQRSSPTYNQDLAEASVELVERDVRGIVHVAGPRVVDRYTFAVTACQVFELDPSRVVPRPTPALGQRAQRPLAAGLRIDRARAVVRTPLRDPVAGLMAMREALGVVGSA
jgi:dTDP-4-dehydrorhamnose reductase